MFRCLDCGLGPTPATSFAPWVDQFDGVDELSTGVALIAAGVIVFARHDGALTFNEPGRKNLNPFQKQIYFWHVMKTSKTTFYKIKPEAKVKIQIQNQKQNTK